jgi:predicted DNA-binding transcriptional regulator YafY
MVRLERLVSMALVLSARRRLRAVDLARQFGVTERTVYRDVRALQHAGFPVEGNAGDGYRVGAEMYLRPLALRPAEAAALLVAAQVFSASADDTLRQQLTSASSKIESILDPETRAVVRRQRARVHVAASARQPAGPLGQLLEAVDRTEVLEIDYVAVDETRSRRSVEPLGLVRIGPAWLLIAYCRLREDVRAFRVDRLSAVRRTGRTFRVRHDVSFAEVVEREQRRRATS